MKKKKKWQFDEVIGNRRVYARMFRSEIEVRIEKVGDKKKYALYGYPKELGLAGAAHQAALEVPDSDIME